MGLSRNLCSLYSGMQLHDSSTTGGTNLESAVSHDSMLVFCVSLIGHMCNANTIIEAQQLKHDNLSTTTEKWLTMERPNEPTLLGLPAELRGRILELLLFHSETGSIISPAPDHIYSNFVILLSGQRIGMSDHGGPEIPDDSQSMTTRAARCHDVSSRQEHGGWSLSRRMVGRVRKSGGRERIFKIQMIVHRAATTIISESDGVGGIGRAG